ncbi:MAG: FGGY-family carbohydrate kinase, partial [Armatimonadota bacterium]
AFCWLDTRAEMEAHDLLRRFPAAYWGRIAGKRPAPWHMLPQALWSRKHEPGLIDGGSKWLMCGDYLAARLAGAFVTDPTVAAGSLLLDISECAWADALLRAFRIPREKMPSVRAAGLSLGPVHPDVAEEVGLPLRCKVALGSQDQKLAAFAAGLRPGVATVSLGTATAVTVLAERPTFNHDLRIPCFPFLGRREWVLEAPIGATGAALRWARKAIGPAGADYDSLSWLAAESQPGCGGVLFFPFLSGATSPHWNPQALAAFEGVSLATGRGDLIRAVMEGVAFEIATNVRALERVSGVIEEVVLFGGGAKSPLWRDIIAASCGRRVRLLRTAEAACLGAAMLAASAAGLCESAEDARRRMAPGSEVVAPDDGLADAYETVFARYEEARERLLSRAEDASSSASMRSDADSGGP